MNNLTMTLREFRKTYRAGAFTEATIWSLPGNQFCVGASTKSGEDVVLARSDNTPRKFRSLAPPARVLRDMGFQDVRLNLKHWSPNQVPLSS